MTRTKHPPSRGITNPHTHTHTHADQHSNLKLQTQHTDTRQSRTLAGASVTTRKCGRQTGTTGTSLSSTKIERVHEEARTHQHNSCHRNQGQANHRRPKHHEIQYTATTRASGSARVAAIPVSSSKGHQCRNSILVQRRGLPVTGTPAIPGRVTMPLSTPCLRATGSWSCWTFGILHV